MFVFSPVTRTRVLLTAVLIAATSLMASQAVLAAALPASTTTQLAITSGGQVVSSGGTVASGSVITLTATVMAGTTAVTPGQVNFCDATAKYCTDIHLLGTAQLTSAGTAALKFRPGIGSHSYKAVFLGNNNYDGITSATTAIAVTTEGGQYPAATSLSSTGSWGSYQLTATVEEIGGISPLTGSVSFQDTSAGSARLATAPLGTSVSGLFWATQVPCMSPLSPTSTAAADFNGDGYLDIAAVDARSQLVQIFVYQPIQGCYQLTASYPTGPSPSGIIVADFNSDGNLDLAIPNAGSNTLTILLGQGDGTFTVSTVSAGTINTALVTADFNGDGIPDLAVANELSGNVTILLGNGDGTFTTSPSLSVSSAQSLAAGDFNGDGKIDLAVPTSVGIAVYLGNGDGTFASSPVSSTVTVPTSTDIARLVQGDFNRDGKQDLAISYGVNVLPTAGQVMVLLGNGDGTFSAAAPSATPDAPFQLAVADFNLDGIPDIAALDIAGNITVLVGLGDGTFASTAYSATNGESTFFQGFAVGDMDGDGRPDILYPGVYPPNSIVMYFDLTRPTETATTAPTSIDPSAVGQHLVVASYPGDANTTSDTSAPVSLWGTPPATTTALALTANGIAASTVATGTTVTLTATVTSGKNNLTTGQVNFCDASGSYCTDQYLLGSVQLTANGSATYKFIPGPGSHSYKAVFQMNGYGAISTSKTVPLAVNGGSATSGQTTTMIAMSGTIGDYTLTATVTGIGLNAPLTGNVSFLDTSNSSAVLATDMLGASTPGLNWNSLSSTSFTNVDDLKSVAGDFNGDGIPDLAVINLNSMTVTILLSNGDGTFKTIAGPTLTTYPTALVTGDFNGDGKLDLAVSSTSSNYNSSDTLTIFLGNEDGTFTPGYNTTGVGSVFTTADFNGDGKLDLLANQGSTGSVILLGNGDGTFATGTTVGAFQTLAVADLNGDAIPDLVVGFITIGTNGVYSYPTQTYMGNGDGTFRVGSNLPGSEEFSSIVTGDFNGDGILDLVGISEFGTWPIIFLGKSDGTFAQGTAITIPSTGDVVPSSILATDLNHDGKLDVVITNGNGYSYPGYVNPDNPDFIALLGNGDGTFNANGANTTLGSTGYAVAADFNGDGIPELAMQAGANLVILQPAPTETATATATGIAPISAGTHNVKASYSGDSNYPSSSSSTVALTATLAVPVITPANGVYTTAQTVTITDSTPGATIYYAAEGIVNTSGYVVYTGPITLSMSGEETIYAYATATGYQQSQSVLSEITVNLPLAAEPVISLASGTYSSAQTVTITDTTPGATIYYTTDGSTPTINSPQYSGAITISSTAPLVASASAPGYSMSADAFAQYFITGSSNSYIYTVAGNETAGYSGDGGPATSADLNFPFGTVLDSAGNLYIADTNNNVIRKVAVGTGIITTIAGTEVGGYSGDNGPATSAQLWSPRGIALDSNGNLYIADTNNSVVRMVSAATGVITTVAGNGTNVYSGDNGPATNQG